jgi:hypothetical protein
MQFNLSQFQHDFVGKSLFAEASCLRIPVGKSPCERLFDDACDIGIKIKSDNTGRIINFILDEEKSASHVWVFSPLQSEKSPVHEVAIYND